MKALIDGDILLYEVGHGAEYFENEDGEKEIPSFDYVIDLLETRIEAICNLAGADNEPVIYLTGENNFRFEIAKTIPYKGNRQNYVKPFHYNNIRNYLIAVYSATVLHGIESDDALAIHQCNSDYGSTIICSRDKDLLMVPGYYYRWEIGNQPSIGPIEISSLGFIEREDKVHAYGFYMFCYQMLIGDPVDNIPGLKGYGPVKAFKILSDIEQKEEMLIEAVKNEYKKSIGENWETYFKEQAALLWICRKLNNNKPVSYLEEIDKEVIWD